MSNQEPSRERVSKVRRADPFYERECAKYPAPLPSREYVVETLAGQGIPVSFERLAKLLDVRPEESESFERRLGAMQRDGQLMRNRAGDYLIPDKADLIRGRVDGHPDGYGFLVPDDRSSDLFLSPHEMQKALHGDRVLVRAIGMDRRGRREGKILSLIHI